MTEYSICLDCKHQDGIWINDREVDTFCTIDKKPNKSNVIILKEQ